MRRFRFKRAMFDGSRLWDAGETANIPDEEFQPPRDAEVWDGKTFVPVPVDDDRNTDMAELSLVAADVPFEDDEEEIFSTPAPKRGRKK
jgi:hypothetical protein